jgi:HupE / UreJ protein
MREKHRCARIVAGCLIARRHLLGSVAIGVAIAIAIAPDVSAHGVSGKDALFLLSLNGPAIIPLMYLGAKHMVTGYDHLLFLVGVIFFLYRLKDILLYVSLFTLGHSVTFLAGAIGGIHANAFLVDAIIGLSIVYKGFENMGGFKALGWQPNTRYAVLGFGLVHGFGLATKLQDFNLSRNGLVTNIVSFNIGVELGQFTALTAVLLALAYWRTRPGYLRHAYVTNAALMAAGFVLAGYQLAGYYSGIR